MDTAEAITRAPVKPRVPQRFLALWCAQTFSAAGDRLFFAAVVWFASATYGITTGTVLVGVAQFLPSALLAPFSGVIVDRLPRYRLLLVSDALRCAVSLAVAGVLAVQGISAATVLISVVVLRVTGLLFQPALQSVLGEIARDEKQLMNLDAWILASGMVAGLFGPALAGMAVAGGAVIAMLANALTFLVSACTLYAARPLLEGNFSNPKQPFGGVLKNWWKAALDGAAVVSRDPVARRVVPALPVIDLVAAGVTLLLPGILLAQGATSGVWYGVLTGTWAAGRFAGLFLARRLLVRTGRGPMLALNALIQSAGVVALGIAPSPAWMLPAFVLIGVPSGCASVCVSSYIQTRIPNDVRGRVFSLLTAVVAVAMPIGPLLGAAVVHFGSSITLACVCLGMLLAVVGLIPATSREVWRL